MGIRRLLSRIDSLEEGAGENRLQELRRKREARRRGSSTSSRETAIRELETQMEEEEEDPRTVEEKAADDRAFREAMDELMLMRRRHALSALMKMSDPRKALRWAVLSGLDEPLPERLQSKMEPVR